MQTTRNNSSTFLNQTVFYDFRYSQLALSRQMVRGYSLESVQVNEWMKGKQMRYNRTGAKGIMKEIFTEWKV